MLDKPEIMDANIASASNSQNLAENYEKSIDSTNAN